MHICKIFGSVLGLTLIASSAWAVDASSGFSKRTAVWEYGLRCELLSTSQLDAVQSGRLQARGALLRAGISSNEIVQMQDIAKNSVTSVSCDHPEALAEIELVQSSHETWLSMRKQSYPATFRAWQTSRDDALVKRRWRVIQDLAADQTSKIRFGLTSFKGAPSLDLLIENRLPPKSVLLRLRDRKKLEDPPGPFLRKLLKLPTEGVAGLTPPDSATNTYFAAERVSAEASLLSAETDIRGVRFGFGADALEAFSQLDPREAVSVDLYWSAGLGKPDRHQRYYIEVGDFMAARLFAQAKDRTG
ncbi:hypothetical protein MNBD_ALPHA06-1130 [hydrothermal vent metagenome]|uniref:Uncharacterized protein n=1 Tax=hydrothermal vent metagenome TaxID=652676 RepID=A0A3B0SJV1_9ZZZZ